MSSETRKWWMIAAVVGVLGGPYVLAAVFGDSETPAGADVSVPVTEGEAFPVISVLDAEEQIRLIHEETGRGTITAVYATLGFVMGTLGLALLIKRVDRDHWASLFFRLLVFATVGVASFHLWVGAGQEQIVWVAEVRGDVPVPVTEGEASAVESLDAEEQIRLIHEQSRRSVHQGAAMALTAVVVALASALYIRKVDYGHWAWLFTWIVGAFWIVHMLFGAFRW